MKEDTLLMFDFYGVIVHEIAPFFFDHHFKDGSAQKRKADYFYPADYGFYSIEEVYRRIISDFHFTKEEFFSEWNELIQVNKPMVDFIRSIKKDATIALISNAAEGLNQYYFEKFHLEDLFDHVTISYQIHDIKPHLPIYQHVLNAFDHPFKKILMTDDNPANLKPLDSLGIQPLLFDIDKTDLMIQRIQNFIDNKKA